jgi:hypothetical protein
MMKTDIGRLVQKRIPILDEALGSKTGKTGDVPGFPKPLALGVSADHAKAEHRTDLAAGVGLETNRYLLLTISPKRYQRIRTPTPGCSMPQARGARKFINAPRGFNDALEWFGLG